MSFVKFTVLSLSLLPLASAHIAFWHPSIWGFNVSAETFSYDNRPVVPLQDMSFKKWWFHGHLGYPPHKKDVFHLPAGGTATAELACDKGATSWYNSSAGGDIRQGNWPCPNQPSTQFHTTGEDDVKGCALAIAYKSDVNDVKPEDFVVFSVNKKCVWTVKTTFDVPAQMPACPPGGCICSWNWIHSVDSGSEQIYMNGFQCDVTGVRADAKPLGKPSVARRCGYNAQTGAPAAPSNCTKGAQQPLFWHQLEGNNIFQDNYDPSYYNEIFNFKNGAQTNVFLNGDGSVPVGSVPFSSSTTTHKTTGTTTTHKSTGTATTHKTTGTVTTHKAVVTSSTRKAVGTTTTHKVTTTTHKVTGTTTTHKAAGTTTTHKVGATTHSTSTSKAGSKKCSTKSQRKRNPLASVDDDSELLYSKARARHAKKAGRSFGHRDI